MLSVAALLGEALDLVLPAIKLGIDITDIVERGSALARQPVPATAAELAAFKVLLDGQRARLEAMTRELEKEPG